MADRFGRRHSTGGPGQGSYGSMVQQGGGGGYSTFPRSMRGRMGRRGQSMQRVAGNGMGERGGYRRSSSLGQGDVPGGPECYLGKHFLSE